MRTLPVWLAAVCLLPMPPIAQAPDVTHDVIPMDQEPHHHLALHNDYIKVFDVQVSPGDSTVLRRNYQDTVAIANGDQLAAADVHQKNPDAQVRLLRPGYMHPIRVDGDTPYHSIAVELMRPQTNFHNVCAEILPGQPLNCPSQAEFESAAYSRQLLIASNETEVALVHVHPHQTMKLFVGPSPQLVVVLDAASIPKGPDQEMELLSHPGDLDWNEYGAFADFRNENDRDRRFIEIIFPRPQ